MQIMQKQREERDWLGQCSLVDSCYVKYVCLVCLYQVRHFDSKDPTTIKGTIRGTI
jgi:hypothetical protein